MKILMPFLLLAVAISAQAEDDELNNSLSFQSGFFNDSALVREERSQISSFTLDSSIYLDLLDNTKLNIHPYFHYEYGSAEDRHMDLRELQLLVDGSNWTFRAGLSQEFWGVVESRHLVDTLGQSDFVNDFRGEAKLGQPMVDFSWYLPAGNLSFYYLPMFRTPAYASPDSRARLPYVVNEDAATYESSRKDRHADFAVRWSQTIGLVDYGVHVFSGTRRSPVLSVDNTGVATPRYILVDQAGLDLQVTVDALLLKLETIYQQGSELEDHGEVVSGFEYTFSQVLGSDIGVGVLAEYLYDERGARADHAFEDDLMLGVRVAFNDESSTVLLATSIRDLDSEESAINLDFSRRIGRNFTIGLSGEWWERGDDTGSYLFLRNEDNLKVALNWFF